MPEPDLRFPGRTAEKTAKERAMILSPDAKNRVFTVDEANAMLPLVRAIVADLVSETRSYLERQERLQQLKGSRELSEDDPYAEELLEIAEDLKSQQERIERYVRELTELGVELKSPTEGLVDFPAVANGRPIYLCWKFDEPEVAYWHELDAGFAGRQPIDPRRDPDPPSA